MVVWYHGTKCFSSRQGVGSRTTHTHTPPKKWLAISDKTIVTNEIKNVLRKETLHSKEKPKRI